MLCIFVFGDDNNREALKKREVGLEPSTIGKFADVLTGPGGPEEVVLRLGTKPTFRCSHLSFLLLVNSFENV